MLRWFSDTARAVKARGRALGKAASHGIKAETALQWPYAAVPTAPASKAERAFEREGGFLMRSSRLEKAG